MAKTKSAGNETLTDKNTEVTVDFPIEGEVITPNDYTFKISVLAETMQVDISINGQEWEPCREALGIWWYDWQGYKPGDYEVKARARNVEGETVMSDSRRFSVAGSSSN